MSGVSAAGFARAMQSRQRLVRQIHLRVQGTGTAAILSGGTEATLVDNGTGDWTITPRVAGRRLLSAVAMPIADAGDIALSLHSSTSASLVRVKGWDGTDGTTAKDIDFHLVITLSDAADQT